MSFDGFLVYVDSAEGCNELKFNLGQTAVGASTGTRAWSIKVRMIYQEQRTKEKK